MADEELEGGADGYSVEVGKDTRLPADVEVQADGNSGGVGADEEGEADGYSADGIVRKDSRLLADEEGGADGYSGGVGKESHILPPDPSSLSSPSEHKAGVRAFSSFLRKRRRPRAVFLLLSTLQLVFGVATFSVGVAAFSFTRSYMVGAFWTGPVVIAASVYNKIVLVLRFVWDDHPTIRKHKWKLAATSLILNVLSVVVNLTGTVLDVMAAYLLHQTDFSLCAYTSPALTANCESDTCPHLHLPPRSCYCCYLYEYRETGGCNTPLLLGKQTYFAGVSSCSAISNQLHPLLYSLAVLALLSVIVNAAFIFNTRPLAYPHPKRTTHAPGSSATYPGFKGRKQIAKHERAYELLTASCKDSANRILLEFVGLLSNNAHSREHLPETDLMLKPQS